MGAISQLGPVDWRQHFPEATAEGIQRAEKHADDEWFLFALAALLRTARRKKTLTADDVAETMANIPDPPTTHEKRAMGAVMKRGSILGWIEPTDLFIKTRRGNQHCCPKQVWRSLTYQGN